jgi:hypothetical protein
VLKAHEKVRTGGECPLVARGELVLFSTRAKNFVHAYDLGVARIEFRVLASSSFAVILTVEESVPNAILARTRLCQSENFTS